MYARVINFTLLAPSLWTVVQAATSAETSKGHTVLLFKSSDNSGVIVEDLDQVLITSLFPDFCNALSFLLKVLSTNGPLQTDLVTYFFFLLCLIITKSGITNLRYPITMIINVVKVIAKKNDNNC